MDRRVYILPVISVLILVGVISNPEITGLMVAEPSETRISADISVSINQDGFVIEDSLVTVYLDDRKSEMAFKEFVRRTGKGYERVRAEVPEIGYDGYGYGGIYTYSLGMSEFDLDTVVEQGEHTLRIKVSYGEHIFSDTSQKIEV